MSFALFESLTEVWVGQYLRLCLVAVKRFPEKENVSMCLVAFQKIFRKIFSGVWKRRRKTQIQKNTSHNLEKNHQRRQIQSDDRAVDRNPRSRSRSRLLREIAINGVISRSVDRDLGSSSLAYIRDLAIDVSRDRDLDPARSREGEIAINGAISIFTRSRSTARSCEASIAISDRGRRTGAREIGADWSSEFAGDRRTD